MRFNRQLLCLNVNFSGTPQKAHQRLKESDWKPYFEGDLGCNICKGEAKWEKGGTE